MTNWSNTSCINNATCHKAQLRTVLLETMCNRLLGTFSLIAQSAATCIINLTVWPIWTNCHFLLLQDRGFVNYYGPQRFGTGQSVQSDRVGLALLKEDMVSVNPILLDECELPLSPTKSRQMYLYRKVKTTGVKNWIWRRDKCCQRHRS